MQRRGAGDALVDSRGVVGELSPRVRAVLLELVQNGRVRSHLGVRGHGCLEINLGEFRVRAGRRVFRGRAAAASSEQCCCGKYEKQSRGRQGRANLLQLTSKAQGAICLRQATPPASIRRRRVPGGRDDRSAGTDSRRCAKRPRARRHAGGSRGTRGLRSGRAIQRHRLGRLYVTDARVLNPSSSTGRRYTSGRPK
jgi:hypothetical protein